MLQVQSEDLEGDVVVVEFRVAERNVDIDGEVIAVLQEQPLVEVGGLLIVRSETVWASKTSPATKTASH